MNTFEINAILERNPVTKKIYKGCFPSNKIPLCKDFPCAFVVNFDEKGEPGTHWCTVVTPNKRIAYMYDSLGTLGAQYIQKYLNRHFKKVTRLKYRFQSEFSTVCGQYAIFFVYASALKWPPRKIAAVLLKSGDPDTFVVDFMKRHILRL